MPTFWTVDLLYAVAGLIVDFMNSGPSLLGAFAAIAVVSPAVVLAHELGHALAARRLLGTNVDVALGSLGKLADVELARVRVQLHAFANPSQASGAATFDASHATARDIVFIAMAGPAASLAGLVPTIALLTAANPGTVIYALLWAATACGVAGVLNVIPFRYSDRRGGSSIRSDGRLALEALAVLRSLR